ncbi:MAG: enoyl-CoA hydratase/isomerase family protein [Acidimicrobiales bacterium]
MTITITRRDDVSLLTWGDGENRINHDSLAQLNEVLDELEGSGIESKLAVVLTGEGKFFCNGLDLGRFEPFSDEYHSTFLELQRTIGRILVFPAYTVAAVNGHAFAGGALLACAFDYRVMREDRGYWCVNEVEIGLALDEGMWSVLANRVPRATATHAAVTAHRYGAVEALAAGIIDETASEDRVLTSAIATAQAVASLDRKAIRYQKRVIHGDEAKHLGFED